jgi:hypothetical protein
MLSAGAVGDVSAAVCGGSTVMDPAGGVRAVRRWGVGQEEPSPGVWRDIEEIAVERSACLRSSL